MEICGVRAVPGSTAGRRDADADADVQVYHLVALALGAQQVREAPLVGLVRPRHLRRRRVHDEVRVPERRAVDAPDVLGQRVVTKAEHGQPVVDRLRHL